MVAVVQHVDVNGSTRREPLNEQSVAHRIAGSPRKPNLDPEMLTRRQELGPVDIDHEVPDRVAIRRPGVEWRLPCDRDGKSWLGNGAQPTGGHTVATTQGACLLGELGVEGERPRHHAPCDVPPRPIRRRVHRGSPSHYAPHTIRVTDRPPECERDSHRVRAQRPSRRVEQARALRQLVERIEVVINAERTSLFIHRAPEPKQIRNEQAMLTRELLVCGPEHVARRDQTVQQHHGIAVRSHRPRPQRADLPPFSTRCDPTRPVHRQPMRSGPQRKRSAQQRSGQCGRTDPGRGLADRHTYPPEVGTMAPTSRTSNARWLNHDNMS